MYSIDHLDAVTQLTDVPQSSVGAPCPMILCGDHLLHLAYIVQRQGPEWDGRTIRIVGPHSQDESCALVHFVRPYTHMFGPPNDEAFHGHPLWNRGLRPYLVFEVANSSWIRRLERMNSVHPYHKKDRFSKLKHFIFAFHDSTFECVAASFDVSIHVGSVAQVLRESWPQATNSPS